MNKAIGLALALVTTTLVVGLLGIRVESWEAENPDGKISNGTYISLYDIASCNIGPLNAVCTIGDSYTVLWSDEVWKK
jgi:hypothetical protein